MKYTVHSGVITLTDEVHTQDDRVATQNLAAAAVAQWAWPQLQMTSAVFASPSQ